MDTNIVIIFFLLKIKTKKKSMKMTKISIFYKSGKKFLIINIYQKLNRKFKKEID